jgi:23S rRNA (guanosine2251-2'-O)-methyltransferase
MEKKSMDALNRPDVDTYRAQDKLPILLILDNVRSGLNVGSIFRSADAFSIEAVWLCGITAQPPHREILKTALGSTDSVSWSYFEDAADALRRAKSKGYGVYAIEQADPKQWLSDFDPRQSNGCALVLGNEVDGVNGALLPLCDGVVEIPQYGTKHSLNVAVAAGIVLWECVKKIKS